MESKDCVICGKEFYRNDLNYRLTNKKWANKKCCGKECSYEYQKLTPNAGWIKKGQRLSKSTEFKKGHDNGYKGHTKKSNLSLKKISDKLSYPEFAERKMNGGYLMIKVKDRWMLKHQYIWLRDNTQGMYFIPDEWIVHHRDGNKLNNHIDNLACIPQDIHATLHGGLR